MNTIKVAWLFPDTFCLYGDRGNMLAFEKIANKGDIKVEFDRVDFETKNFNPMDYDFIYCPPGEITAQIEVMKYLLPHKDEFLEYIKAGKPMLVCSTSQVMFGKEVKRFNYQKGKYDDTPINMMGITNTSFVEKDFVYGDDLWFKAKFNGKDMEIIGSQIQMMDVFTNEKTFGTINYGYGNNGKTREEGSMIKNAIFTNCLGPILVLSPWLTKEIILLALKNKGSNINDFDLDMDLEEKAILSKIQFIKEKGKTLPIYED